MTHSFLNILINAFAFHLMLFGFSPCGLGEPSLIDSLNNQNKTYVVIRAQNPTANWEHTGAGVVIHPQGWIVTNSHIIWQAQKIKIIFSDGQEFDGRAQKVFQDLDLSFLKIKPASPLQPIDWADSDRVNFGDEVVAIGHSKLLKNTLSGGQIVGMAQNDKPGEPRVSIIETNMDMYAGDSGGPVFDNHGKFLGIIVGKQKLSSQSVFLLPSNIILKHFLSILKNKNS